MLGHTYFFITKKIRKGIVDAKLPPLTAKQKPFPKQTLPWAKKTFPTSTAGKKRYAPKKIFLKIKYTAKKFPETNSSTAKKKVSETKSSTSKII
jgi:hypothetical protein